jgi:hypothetical protein
MPRSAERDIKVVDDSVPKAAAAIKKLETLRNKWKNDPEFRKLYETDFMAALEKVGIDLNARTEMGLPPLEKGKVPADSKSCITPQGNACLCCPTVEIK